MSLNAFTIHIALRIIFPVLCFFCLWVACSTLSKMPPSPPLSAVGYIQIFCLFSTNILYNRTLGQSIITCRFYYTYVHITYYAIKINSIVSTNPPLVLYPARININLVELRKRKVSSQILRNMYSVLVFTFLVGTSTKMTLFHRKWQVFFLRNII